MVFGNKNKDDSQEKEQYDDKALEFLDKGWIKCSCFIELMAVTENVTEESMKEHIEKIRKEEGIYLSKADYKEIEEVDNPPGSADTAFSQIVDTEILFRNFAMLVYFVTNYGPSSLEILEPSEIKMGQGEATSIANALSSLVHQFAAQGAGGIVFSQK